MPDAIFLESFEREVVAFREALKLFARR